MNQVPIVDFIQQRKAVLTKEIRTQFPDWSKECICRMLSQIVKLNNPNIIRERFYDETMGVWTYQYEVGE